MTQTLLNIGVLAVVVSLLGLGMHAKSANAQRTLASAQAAYGVSAPTSVAGAMRPTPVALDAAALDARAVAR